MIINVCIIRYVPIIRMYPATQYPYLSLIRPNKYPVSVSVSVPFLTIRIRSRIRLKYIRVGYGKTYYPSISARFHPYSPASGNCSAIIHRTVLTTLLFSNISSGSWSIYCFGLYFLPLWHQAPKRDQSWPMNPIASPKSSIRIQRQ
jgi:hypothetical protein